MNFNSMEKTPLIVFRNQLMNDAKFYLKHDQTELGVALLKYADHISLNLLDMEREMLYHFEVSIKEKAVKEYIDSLSPKEPKRCVLCRTFLS